MPYNLVRVLRMRRCRCLFRWERLLPYTPEKMEWGRCLSQKHITMNWPVNYRTAAIRKQKKQKSRRKNPPALIYASLNSGYLTTYFKCVNDPFNVIGVAGDFDSVISHFTSDRPHH